MMMMMMMMMRVCPCCCRSQARIQIFLEVSIFEMLSLISKMKIFQRILDMILKLHKVTWRFHQYHLFEEIYSQFSIIIILRKFYRRMELLIYFCLFHYFLFVLFLILFVRIVYLQAHTLLFVQISHTLEQLLKGFSKMAL